MCQRKIIPEHSLSLRTDFQRKKLVLNTLNLYDGLKVFFVRSAGVLRHGRWLAAFGSVLNAANKSRSLRELLFKTAIFRFKLGFGPCGIFAAKRMEWAHWVCNAFSGLEATAAPGWCYTNCEGLWFDLIARNYMAALRIISAIRGSPFSYPSFKRSWIRLSMDVFCVVVCSVMVGALFDLSTFSIQLWPDAFNLSPFWHAVALRKTPLRSVFRKSGMIWRCRQFTDELLHYLTRYCWGGWNLLGCSGNWCDHWAADC